MAKIETIKADDIEIAGHPITNAKKVYLVASIDPTTYQWSEWISYYNTRNEALAMAQGFADDMCRVYEIYLPNVNHTAPNKISGFKNKE